EGTEEGDGPEVLPDFVQEGIDGLDRDYGRIATAGRGKQLPFPSPGFLQVLPDVIPGRRFDAHAAPPSRTNRRISSWWSRPWPRRSDGRSPQGHAPRPPIPRSSPPPRPSGTSSQPLARSRARIAAGPGQSGGAPAGAGAGIQPSRTMASTLIRI